MRLKLAALLVAGLAVPLVGGEPAGAVVPAPVMTGFVPLAADATQATMENANSSADPDLDFTVGITNAGPGAVMTYDHWEDGFEADLTNPAQGSTEVWGDGAPGNGDAETYCGIRCAGDLLPAGAVFVLRNIVPTPRTGAVLWDGGDRVASTRGFVITAGAFSTPLGSVLSASASAYDTSKWGTEYWVPVGEDMVPPAGTSDAFSTSSLQIMAAEPGTVVGVDLDNDDVDDLTQTIGRGEVMFVDGGVLRGTRVHSSAPVQVHLGAGDAGATYELRWFTLFPTNLLSADYLNPVGSSMNTQRTITYLFNPGPDAVTVTPTCPSCAGTIALAAGAGASHASPVGEAVRFTGTGPFVAVGAAGSESGAAPGGAGDGSSTYDWGFGLVPAGLLTTKVLLGWAPGNSTNPPGAANPANYDDDPVWVSALANTTVYVDFDGDPTTGAFGGSCDGSYDTTVALTALVSTRIHDSSDGDMTGASIFTCDGTKLAGAWGEDPSTAPAGSPGFDAGYALIPSTTMVVDKSAVLSDDTNSDGRIGPGDELEFEIAISDAGNTAFNNLAVADALPAGTSYVPGSSVFDDGVTTTPFADDVAPPAATAYPFDEAGAPIPSITPGQTVYVRYRLRIADPFPAGVTVVNGVTVVADESNGGDSIVIDLVEADLSVAAAVTAGPTYVGDQATFRVTVANAGPDQAGGVDVTALVPAGLTFVSAAPSQGSYDDGTGVWSVGTLLSGGSATLDITVAVDDATPSALTAEVTDTDAADPDSTPANGAGGEDDLASASVTAAPMADLSLTMTITSGPDTDGSTTVRYTVTNAGPSAATGVVVTEQPPAGSSFVSATPVTSALVDGTFDGGTGVWTLPTIAPGDSAEMTVVRVLTAPGTGAAQITAADQFDPDSTPGTATIDAGAPPAEDDEAMVTVPEVADVELEVTLDDPPAYLGDTATVTVRVSNAGPFDSQGVEVTAVIPAGLDVESVVPSVGTFDPVTGIWTVGDLAVGDEPTLTFVLRVNQGGSSQVTAEVTASSTADVDSTPANDTPSEDDQGLAGIALAGETVGGVVFDDRDGDGVRDDGEPGLAGVTVTVTWAGGDGVIGGGDDVTWTVETDESGAWSQPGVPAGPVRVAVDPADVPTGMTPIADPDGTGTPHTADLVVTPGEDLADLAFAYADTVAPTTTTTPTGSLATTGSDAHGLAATALTVLVVGLALALLTPPGRARSARAPR